MAKGKDKEMADRYLINEAVSVYNTGGFYSFTGTRIKMRIGLAGISRWMCHNKWEDSAFKIGEHICNMEKNYEKNYISHRPLLEIDNLEELIYEDLFE